MTLQTCDGGLSGVSRCADTGARTPIGVSGNFILINNLLLQKTAFAAGPVYKSSNELSTKDIEAKIKLINAEEVIVKEEQLLESIVTSEVEDEIEQLTDIVAAEIVFEELAEEMAEEMVELELAEKIAEGIAEEIDELTDIEATAIVAEELAEGSRNIPTIDFGDITEVLL